ncbi:hypothetical protein AMECASPLE_031339 [Ameca splendens]|uniref:Uncharacterized protein n=1 Tax=Ameca splendens TaxID=208324 RepID=A0ABV0XVB4_9TELE
MEDQIIVAVCGKPELQMVRRSAAGIQRRFVSQRGTADLRTGSWIDGSTAEIDRHPDAAPGVGGGTLRTVPVPEESGGPRDVDFGGVFWLSTGKT